MKLTKRIKILTLIYLLFFPILLSFIAFGVFQDQSTRINSAIVTTIGSTLGEVNQITALQMMLIAMVVSIVPSILFLNTNVKKAITFSILFGFLLFPLVIVLLLIKNTLLPIFYLELALILGIEVAIIVKMTFASYAQNFLEEAFSTFVSEDMLKELMKNPEKLKLQGKEVTLTVMFIDIRGFTAFSESNSPTLVVKRLNELLDTVTHIILDHKGTVDKYMGDAIMAFWGAPSVDKKQATNAANAALAIKQVIDTETEFDVGFGINDLFYSKSCVCYKTSH